MRRVAILLACTLPFVSVQAAGAEDAGPPPDQSAWVGTWQLDKAASDDSAPMLDAMDVPWYVRPLAGAFTPEFQVTQEGPGFAWASQTPLGSRTQHFRADHAPYDGTDLLDRSFEQSSWWQPDGHLVVDRETTLPDGKKVDVRSEWVLAGDQLTNQMKVRPESGKPFELERVFKRKK